MSTPLNPDTAAADTTKNSKNTQNTEITDTTTGTTLTHPNSGEPQAAEKKASRAGAIDFVGRSKLWYSIAAGLLAISIAAIAIRGFSLSLDFEGGTKMTMPAGDLVAEEVEDTFIDATGVTPEITQIVGAGDSRTLEINSERLTQDQIDSARRAISDEHKPKDAEGNVTTDAIGDSTVSESWGSTITQRMLIAMGVFLVLVFIYITVRLEREMAAAAMLALLVDAVLLPGMYSLFGFEVSPASIIGFLTVLSFSIYDTVIVFDKVRENTAGLTESRRSTYAEQANLAVNQTVVRSINTSIISALPILSLMIVAVWLMGVGTLKDLALIQLLGVIEGVFSSIFLATPILVSLMNRRRSIKEHNAAVAAYRAGESDSDPAGASLGDAAHAGANRSADASVDEERDKAGENNDDRSAQPAAAGKGKRTIKVPQSPRGSRTDRSSRTGDGPRTSGGLRASGGPTGDVGATWRPDRR